MMNYSDNGGDEFAPNPFRSTGSGAPNDLLGSSNNMSHNSNPISNMMMPQQQQQPLPQTQVPDPYSGMTGTLDMPATPPPAQTSTTNPMAAPYAGSSPDPSLWSGTMDQRAPTVASYGSGGNNNANNNNGTAVQGMAFNFFSWRSWVACCTVQSYAPYFDVDTADVSARLRAALLQFYQPDHFRTSLVGDAPTTGTAAALKGPDLYGPVWIVFTLVFVLAATSNIYRFWEHAKQERSNKDNDTQLETFEVDIYHLLHACNVVVVFVFGIASAFWMAASCLGMSAVSWALWVCVYGYSQAPILVAAFLVCIFPLHILTWCILLAAATASGLLVLRNLSTPLMAQDTGANTKAGPLILAMLVVHFIYFLVLKFTFFP